MKQNKLTRKGAVSIFIVIFTTILISIIAISFLKIMLLDQQRSLTSDLSNSAYDSALIGIEDAKRALAKYATEICNDESSADCNLLAERVLNGESCDAVQTILGLPVNQEVPIVTTNNNNDQKIDQAYTCVKIKYFTDDYERDIQSNSGEQIMVPLNLTKAADKITLEWNLVNEAGNSSSAPSSTGGVDRWPTSSGWGGSMPPVLVAQFIQKNDEKAKILFLKPSTGGKNFVSFNAASGGDPKDKIVPVNCGGSSGSNVKCQIELGFPTVSPNSQTHFLKLSKIYPGKTTIKMHFRGINSGTASAVGSSDLTRFRGIQPEIDSNGRANYLFRRVKARVEFTAGRFPFPMAGFHIKEGGLCKDFAVTDYKLVEDQGGMSTSNSGCSVEDN